MSSIYENTTLYMPLIQPQFTPRSILMDFSSYWHVSALFSIAYDSITLPTRTRPEHSYAMDMHDLTARINVHGQRKFANPSLAVLFNHPGKDDLLNLGWLGVNGERGLTATVFRDTAENIDDLTKVLSQGNVVTER
jgi:hypothetical protein